MKCFKTVQIFSNVYDTVSRATRLVCYNLIVNNYFCEVFVCPLLIREVEGFLKVLPVIANSFLEMLSKFSQVDIQKCANNRISSILSYLS